jgi:serine/threonine-protein kinase HipA
LSPAYDLVNTLLVNPADDEELALTLNGRKKKLKRKDFEAAMSTLKLDSQLQQNIFRKMEKAWPAWEQWIDMSFLTEDYKFQYKSVIQERLARLR